MVMAIESRHDSQRVEYCKCEKSTLLNKVCLFTNTFQKYLYSGASVHERPCSRTIWFTNKFFSGKNVSDDERFLGLRTRKLATAASWEYQRGSQLLVNFGSVHIPAWFRLTNISVHERPVGTD
jgi:hypothetical protein